MSAIPKRNGMHHTHTEHDLPSQQVDGDDAKDGGRHGGQGGVHTVYIHLDGHIVIARTGVVLQGMHVTKIFREPQQQPIVSTTRTQQNMYITD